MASRDIKELLQIKQEQLKNFRVYTLTELEPVLGITHRTLLQYVKDGKLKAVKIGGKWKVSEGNLKTFINGEDKA